MRSNRFRFMTCLVLLALAAAAGQVLAEGSASPAPSTLGTIVLGIIEGPDPIPQVIWQPLRDVDPSGLPGASDAVTGDGRPDIAYEPGSGWPHVVWARHLGDVHRIAYSRWNGDRWNAIEFLVSTDDHLADPRVHVDGNGVYVVWWDTYAGAIRLVSRSHVGRWTVVEPVVEGVGMRPSVVTWGGAVLVAYETTGSVGNKEIVVARRLGQGEYLTEFSRTVASGVPLDVVLHSEQGRLWMDWRRSFTEFAYSRFDDGAWGPVLTVPWSDQSWVMLQEVRRIIRSLVLAWP